MSLRAALNKNALNEDALNNAFDKDTFNNSALDNSALDNDILARVIKSQPKTRLRRRAIVQLLLRRVDELTDRGRHPEQALADALQVDPRSLVTQLRAQFPNRLKRVRDRQLREDILLIKRCLADHAPPDITEHP